MSWGNFSLRVQQGAGTAAQGSCGVPSLEALIGQVEWGPGQLSWWLETLHIAGGWNWMSIVVLFNPGHSVIL